MDADAELVAGLAVVRRFADDLGGTLRLEPDVASGTTFSLTLPLSLSTARIDGR